MLISPPVTVSETGTLSVTSVMAVSHNLVSFFVGSVDYLTRHLAGSFLSSSATEVIPLPKDTEPDPSTERFVRFTIGVPRRSPRIKRTAYSVS